MFILTHNDTLVNLDELACIYKNYRNGYAIKANGRFKNSKSETVAYTLGEYSSIHAAKKAFKELQMHIASNDNLYAMPKDNEELEFSDVPEQLEFASEQDLYFYQRIIKQRLEASPNKDYPFAGSLEG